MSSRALAKNPSRSFRRVLTIDAVAESLRNAIFNGEFGLGEPVREVELAASYNIGRHTLRAAFRVLVNEGVLTYEPYRGVSVPVLSERDVVDIYRARRVIELEALESVLHSREIPERLVSAVAHLAGLPSSAKWSEVVDADMAIHRAIVAAADSARLDRFFSAVEAETRLCISQLWGRVERAPQVAEDHAALLRILQRGDAAAARSALRRHLSPPDLVPLTQTPAEQ